MLKSARPSLAQCPHAGLSEGKHAKSWEGLATHGCEGTMLRKETKFSRCHCFGPPQLLPPRIPCFVLVTQLGSESRLQPQKLKSTGQASSVSLCIIASTLHPATAKHPSHVRSMAFGMPVDKRSQMKAIKFRECVLATQATQLYKTQTRLCALANSLTDPLNHVVHGCSRRCRTPGGDPATPFGRCPGRTIILDSCIDCLSWRVSLLLRDCASHSLQDSVETA